MRRVRVVARGDVQRVGYREEVFRIARRLGVVGYVENLKPYDVLIVAEGDEETLREFLRLVRVDRYPIHVEELEVEWSEATGEFSYFEVRYGDWREELLEGMDFVLRLLYRVVELAERGVKLMERRLELTERSVELGERSVKLGEMLLKRVDEGFEV